MNILKRYESDDFDQSYDDYAYLEDGEVVEEGSSKPFLVKAIAMILAVTGIAYGANIALTSGSGTKAEFGQGFVTATACDTIGGITVIPYAGFVNDSGSGKFTLDSIILENIDDTCVGKDFIIQAWGDTGTALNLSETGTAGANYTQFDIARFTYVDSKTVVMVDTSPDANIKGAFIDVDVLTDTGDGSTEFRDDLASIQITFDPDRTISFADATLVRKITIQTVKTGS
jgi:hypothetical protein